MYVITSYSRSSCRSSRSIRGVGLSEKVGRVKSRGGDGLRRDEETRAAVKCKNISSPRPEAGRRDDDGGDDGRGSGSKRYKSHPHASGEKVKRKSEVGGSVVGEGCRQYSVICRNYSSLEVWSTYLPLSYLSMVCLFAGVPARRGTRKHARTGVHRQAICTHCKGARHSDRMRAGRLTRGQPWIRPRPRFFSCHRRGCACDPNFPNNFSLLG